MAPATPPGESPRGELVSRACAWLQAADAATVGQAAQLVLASAGTLCDGAKPGCALKVGLGAARAVRCAELALAGIAAPPWRRAGRQELRGDRPRRQRGPAGCPALEAADAEVLRLV